MPEGSWQPQSSWEHSQPPAGEQLPSSAGGAEALAGCVCERAAGPVDLNDTLTDAFEAAACQGVCTAALRALCALAAQQPAAVAGLSPAAEATLLMLRSGPDAVQRRAAEVLLDFLQGAKSAGPSGAGLVHQPSAAPAASPFAGVPLSPEPSGNPSPSPAWSPDLLQSPSQSSLSELTPTRLKQYSRPYSQGQQSRQGRQSQQGQQPLLPQQSSAEQMLLAEQALSAGTPAGSGAPPRRQPSMEGSAGGGGNGWRGQPSLGAQQGQPGGGAPGSRQPSSGLPAGDALDFYHLPEGQWQASRGLWEGDSRTSSLPASADGWPLHPHPTVSAAGHSFGRAPTSFSQVSGLSEGQASRAASAAGGGSLPLTRSDISICQHPSGREWKLGEGGFGVVLKGLMNGVDEVAVKRVKAERPSDAELAAFYREVHTLASLRHRNVVQYYGACLEPGSMMIVTEYLKGGDLYSALRQHPQALSWGRLGRRVALDVALGLNYLHSHRPPMSHRDLKSPNVLLSEEGVAKIADVGMLRRQAAELITAQPVMTPLWSAPEVLRRERAGVKADIWSFGVLVWEIVSGEDIAEHQPLALTRQLALLGPQAAAEVAAQGAVPEAGEEAPPARAVALPAGAPPVARRIFEACTQMDPFLRPSAAQLVEWLREAEG